MCLPLQFLKIFITLNCLFFMILGFVVVISSFTLINSQITETALLQMIEGMLILIFGLIGLMGQSKQNACVLAIYSACMAGMGILTILITSTLFFMEHELQHNQTCDNSAVINHELIKQQVDEAKQNFCKYNCICYISPDTQWPSPTYLFDNLITYTQESSNKDMIQYMNCEKAIVIEKSVPSILQRLEEKYSCSGWCKKAPIYYFSDVNRGVPEADKGCYSYYMREYYKSVAQAFIIYFLMDILYLSNFVFACCLCFHPSKRQKRIYRIYQLIEYEQANFYI